MNLQGISICHVQLYVLSACLLLIKIVIGGSYRFGSILRRNSRTVKEKSARLNTLALSVAESLHQLAQGSLALYLEEDFIVVIGDLDVKMLRLSLIFGST